MSNATKPNIKIEEETNIVVGFLTKALEHDSEDMRYDAVKALGGIADDRAVEPLCKALGDSSYKVRRAAAAALGEIGGERTVEIMATKLKDTSRDVRYAVVDALGHIGLRQILEKKPPGKVVEPLIMALEDRNREVRQFVIGTLSQLGDQRTIEPLIKKLRCDRVAFVRFSAGFALFEMVYYGRIDSRRVVEPLINALKNMDPFERVLEEVMGTAEIFAFSIYVTDSEFEYLFEYLCRALDELKAMDERKHREVITSLRRTLEKSWMARNGRISVKERIAKLMNHFDSAKT
jgi:HEAT repeat protein